VRHGNLIRLDLEKESASLWKKRTRCVLVTIQDIRGLAANQVHQSKQSPVVTLGLVNVVEREGDLTLAKHEPSTVEQLGRNLRTHASVDHGFEVGSAVELTC
jgi:hypothetical protein